MVRKKEKQKPLRSIEQFNHFRCGHCEGWWGIGDAPTQRKEWFCPWCGIVNTYQTISS